MAFAQKVSLSAFRHDDFQEIMAIEGYDLTGADLSLAIKLHADAPGDPILHLVDGAAPGTQGLRLVEVTADDDGITTSWVEALVPKASFVSALEPYQPNVFGGDTVLAFDFQWKLAEAPDPDFTNVEETVLFGDLIIKGSING